LIEPKTMNAGSVWDVALSSDPQQNFLYVADGENSLIHILRRDTLEILTAFGEGGRQPGQWHGVHNIATDSQGNIYTTETYEGKRIQKFTYKGLGSVTKQYQGTPWPASAR
jgi:DNA-binding beta-propeller fold protein YncE